MKTLFIEQLTAETGQFVDWFQVAQVDRKAKKDGAPYYAMKLRDRTGDISANLWTIPEGLTLKAGDVVKVEAETGTYKDALQLKLKRVRLADPDEVVRDDYMPASKKDRNTMLRCVYDWTCSLTNQELGAAVRECLVSVEDMLRDAPAAKGVHQAYLGGLLEHTLMLCRLVEAVCGVYPDLNKDVMVAGAILHDIGKVFELCYQDHIGYTRAGTLTGHIIQGSVLWAKYSGALDPATRDHVQHIIASHHGQKEWGAAVLPMTREAQTFHLLDLMDSRYEMLTNAVADGTDADGLTPWNFKLGSAVWSGK